MVASGRWALPMFFCFIAYQLMLYLGFVYTNMHGSAVASLVTLTIAFCIFIQIIFGAWDSLMVAKIFAAIFLILSGALALMAAFLHYDKQGRTMNDWTLFMMLNYGVVSTLSFCAAILQFIWLNLDEDDD